MSKQTRNSGFKRNSRKNKGNADRAARSPSKRRSAPKKGVAAKPRRSKGVVAPAMVSAPRSPKATQEQKNAIRSHSPSKISHGALWIYGQHAAKAALKNPKRTIHDIYATVNAAERLELNAITQTRSLPPTQTVLPSQIDGLFANPVTHQGICLLYTSPSPRDQRGSRMPSSA